MRQNAAKKTSEIMTILPIIGMAVKGRGAAARRHAAEVGQGPRYYAAGDVAGLLWGFVFS